VSWFSLKGDAIYPGLLLKSLRAYRKGDFSVRLPEDLTGVEGEVSQAFNEIVDFNQHIVNELIRIVKAVGTEGRFKERASIGATSGAWAQSIDAVNQLIDDLVQPIVEVGNRILSELAPLVNAQYGVLYLAENLTDTAKRHQPDEMVLKMLSSYAYKERKHLSNVFHIGEGLVGQCALEKQRILITKVPDDYIKISSDLGEGTPGNIVVLPVIFEGELQAVCWFSKSKERYFRIKLKYFSVYHNKWMSRVAPSDFIGFFKV
jgi:hypothetical protein